MVSTELGFNQNCMHKKFDSKIDIAWYEENPTKIQIFVLLKSIMGARKTDAERLFQSIC
jgi:hypothetical protein